MRLTDNGVRLAGVGAVLLCLFARAAMAQEAAGSPAELRSPDGRIALRVTLPAAESRELPRWAVEFRGREVCADGRLSLVVEGPTELLAGARLESSARRDEDVRIPVWFGKADHAEDRFRELRLVLRRADCRSVHVVFRCYDDAVAFRYEVPAGADPERLRILREGTSFGLVGDPKVYTQYLEHFRTSHEHPVQEVALGDLPAGQLLDVPLTALHPDGMVVAITEAALLRYAGLSLRREEGARALAAAFAPRADGGIVARPLPLVTPWRVVLLADRLGALLESQTLYCLNDPPEEDPSWVHPGKLTWPWWNHYHFEVEDPEPILSLAAAKKHLDWCAAHGIAYHAIVADGTDTPWYVQSKPGLFPGPDTDATRPRADLDLAAIRRYADAVGVGLWTWVHQGAVRGREEEVFAALERLGWDGVMVDFLDADDQDTVEFAEAVLRAAGRHHVLVNFHGMYKPTGWRRTFPHLMNHEGSLNLEYLKWSDLCTPEHTLRVVFTRLVAGPMGYHQGGFRSVPRAGFRPRSDRPEVLGTRGHHLALYVCLDDPAPMVSDYPAAYRDQAGFDVIREVPTWWDETRVLAADMGRLLVTARRKGGTWWVGGIAAGESRAIEVPLAFLPVGRHALRLWRDGDAVATDPNDLAVEEREVGAGEVLRVVVGEGGGLVGRITTQEP